MLKKKKKLLDVLTIAKNEFRNHMFYTLFHKTDEGVLKRCFTEEKKVSPLWTSRHNLTTVGGIEGLSGGEGGSVAWFSGGTKMGSVVENRM